MGAEAFPASMPAVSYVNQEARKRIANNFTYHPPKGDQVPRYGKIRDTAKDFALMISEFCPESREKSLAMTNLEEAVMWANAAIARNE
jgi:hypothetical protein